MSKVGDVIIVKIGGKPYETVIDENGTQRFRANSLIKHLDDSGQINFNRLFIDCQNGKFSQEDCLHFLMATGYSVSALASAYTFKDLEIENPLW